VNEWRLLLSKGTAQLPGAMVCLPAAPRVKVQTVRQREQRMAAALMRRDANLLLLPRLLSWSSRVTYSALQAASIRTFTLASNINGAAGGGGGFCCRRIVNHAGGLPRPHSEIDGASHLVAG